MMSWISDPEAWIALVTLTSLEIVLGIDNLVFLSILTGRLPEKERPLGRRVGLVLAMLMRIGLILALGAIMRLTSPLFTVGSNEISGRDMILIAGGLFLLAKATLEIHHSLENAESEPSALGSASFAAVIGQVVMIDIVFSLDSVITAVGMAKHIPVMVAAVLISVVMMALFVNAICDFVDRHPTIKMLATSFLLLIGVALIGDGLGMHIPKGYIYFAMGFSFFVEMLNMRFRAMNTTPKP